MKLDLNHIPNRLTARIDTSGLRDAIAKLRQYGREQSVARSLARKLSRVLRSLVRELVRSEMFNTRVWLKYNMLHDGEWRAEVTQSLGGELALTRWDVRKSKADTEIIAPRIQAYKPGAQAEIFSPDTQELKPPKPRRVTTDDSGLFRLAPIKRHVRPLTEAETFAKWTAKTWRESMAVKPKPCARAPETIRPIPLTPHELRGETNIRRPKIAVADLGSSIEADYGLPDMSGDMSATNIMRAVLDFDKDAVAPKGRDP